MEIGRGLIEASSWMTMEGLLVVIVAAEHAKIWGGDLRLNLLAFNMIYQREYGPRVYTSDMC